LHQNTFQIYERNVVGALELTRRRDNGNVEILGSINS